VVLALLVLVGLAGAGVGVFLAVRTPTAPVPKVVGLDVEEARNLLEKNSWSIGVKYERLNGSRVDEVLAQSVPRGRELAEGRRIDLTVSLGNELTVLPSVVNLPEAEARAAITAAGLVVGDFANPNDEVVPAGVVMAAAAPADGQGQLPQGSAVALTVSSGPAPRSVPPGLVGQESDAVRRALEGVQLKVNVNEVFSADVPAGTVIAVSQLDNASVPRDTVVDVTVSKGPEPRPIPNVTGQSVTDATAALSASGFPVAAVEGSPANPVIATDPPAGESHLPGTTVRLFTRRR